MILVLTNVSVAPCTLVGYPGVAGVDATGAQVVQARRTLSGYLGGCLCTAPQLITVRPRQQASSLLEGDSGGGAECLVVRSLLVTPPNTTTSTAIAKGLATCDLQVHPVVAGGGGGSPARSSESSLGPTTLPTAG